MQWIDYGRKKGKEEKWEEKKDQIVPSHPHSRAGTHAQALRVHEFPLADADLFLECRRCPNTNDITVFLTQWHLTSINGN